MKNIIADYIIALLGGLPLIILVIFDEKAKLSTVIIVAFLWIMITAIFFCTKMIIEEMRKLKNKP